MSRAELEAKYDEFFKKYNNSYVDFDGVYGNQCFDLIQKWNRDYLNGPFLGGMYAYQIYGQGSPFYTSIPNTPDYIPLKGDILVWSKNYNGYAGHTGVATGKGDLNTFECFEQNDPTNSNSHVKKYSYLYVTGGLRCKTTEPNQPVNYQKMVDEIRTLQSLSATDFKNKVLQIVKG